jgi:hypothetical protein
MPDLGIVSSVQFTGTSLETAFVTGLGGTGWGAVNRFTREEYGNYGALIQDVHYLNGLATVTVIAAVGGLPSALAAATASTKPYLVLIGALPVTRPLDPHGLLRGGVNLNAPGLNLARNGFLANRPNYPHIPPNRICLMYDQTNSELTQVELPPWRANHWPTVNVLINNHVPDFVRAFHDARAVADAVVVSSDPLFSYYRDLLVQASALPTCYPFEYDTQGAYSPNAGSMWYGPDLDAAYQSMGAEVGHVLSAPAVARPLILAPPAGPHYY